MIYLWKMESFWPGGPRQQLLISARDSESLALADRVVSFFGGAKNETKSKNYMIDTICTYIYIWVNFITTSLFSLTGILVRIRGVIPNWPQQLRLVNYDNLPIYIYMWFLLMDLEWIYVPPIGMRVVRCSMEQIDHWIDWKICRESPWNLWVNLGSII